MTKPRTQRIAGRAKAASDAVKMAFLPKKEYLEKNTAKGMARVTEITADNSDSHTVKAKSLHV